MTSFDDRENAFESKYAHDEAMQFRTSARRNRLLGQWAGGLMGKAGEDLAAYAKEVVLSDFDEAGDEDVYRKVAGDLGSRASETEIRAKMTETMVEARRQIMTDS